MLCILNRLQHNVNITFICTGKSKIHVTHFIVIFALLQQSGTEPATSLRYACIIFLILNTMNVFYHISSNIRSTDFKTHRFVYKKEN